MQIEIRLRKVLKDHGLDHHGVSSELARDLGCHRHTIGALYRGDPANPSFALLAQIVGWLRGKGVPGEVLPQALFGLKPDYLWEAVARTSGVTVYVAEYHEQLKEQRRLWVSRRDAVLAGSITEELYGGFNDSRHAPAVHTEFIPFHFGATGADRQRHLKEDASRAVEVLHRLEQEGVGRTSIIIGSQEVNYLLECWVAALFGCEPFKAHQRKPAVPIYMCSRHATGPQESCFGGLHPPGLKGDSVPGIYYLIRKDTWEVYPWQPDGADAGALLVVHEPSTNTIQMAIFGYSGRATETMARRVVRDAAPFWPPTHDVRGKKVGLYVFRFDLGGREPPPNEAQAAKIVKMEYCQLSSPVLRAFL